MKEFLKLISFAYINDLLLPFFSPVSNFLFDLLKRPIPILNYLSISIVLILILISINYNFIMLVFAFCQRRWAFTTHNIAIWLWRVIFNLKFLFFKRTYFDQFLIVPFPRVKNLLYSIDLLFCTFSLCYFLPLELCLLDNLLEA